MRSSLLLALAIACSALAWPSNVHADTLKLKDGKRFDGTLEDRRDGMVWFRHSVGGVMMTQVYLDEDVEALTVDAKPKSPLPDKPIAPAPAPAAAKPRPVEAEKPVPRASSPASKPVPEARPVPARLEDPRLADRASAVLVHREWRDLAPFLSMKNELCLEDVTVESLKRTFRHVADLCTRSFVSHPELSRVGEPHLKYLASAESRIIPVFRANFKPADVFDDLEGVLVAGLAELMSRQMESQVLHAWQLDYDARARAAYSELLPLVRSMAPPASEGSPGAIVTSPSETGAGLVVRNGSGRQLTEVTLAMEMRSLDGRSSMHYFYIDSWADGETFRPRAAADWRSVGLAGTTDGKVELYSKELACASSEFTVPANACWTVQHVLPRLARSSPKRAFETIRAAKPRFTNDPQMLSFLDKCRAEAAVTRSKMLSSLQRQLSYEENRLTKVPLAWQESIRKKIAGIRRQINDLD